MKKINITIDGPASSGKGTTSIELAKKINYRYIDSGKFYRVVCYYALKNKIKINDFKEKDFNKTKNKIRMSKRGKIFLDGLNVESKIRTKKINEGVSQISKKIFIRNFINNYIKKMIKEKGFILDGRDAGTSICPKAELKIYLDCDILVRSKRRYLEFKKNKIEISQKEVLDNLKKRDEIDKNKGKHSLKKEKDMILIDTTKLKISSQVNEIFKLYKKVIEKN